MTSSAASAIELGYFSPAPEIFLWKSLDRTEKILTQARHGKREPTDVFRAEVDFEQVLYRLALHAQSLFTAAACLWRAEVVLPGGDSAADLASATLLKLLDPLDTSVTWSPTKGPLTTAGVLAYLREVLRRDFLDFVRSKRATTSVYPDGERADGQDLSRSTLDQRVASYGNPEAEHLQSERLVWLVEQFKDDPELLEILRLQLEPAGYNAFSSQELATRLSTTVVEIENRRRRVIRRLRKLADARLIEEAEHV